MKPNDVLEAVADVFGLEVINLRSTSRKQHIVFARQAAMLIIRDYIPWLSVEDIGRMFRKDHTTVLWGVNAARQRGRSEKWYQQAVLEALEVARQPKARAA
jgi:chromosomal replication initiation ATPase DnaA